MSVVTTSRSANRATNRGGNDNGAQKVATSGKKTEGRNPRRCVARNGARAVTHSGLVIAIEEKWVARTHLIRVHTYVK